ncbi:hypothetical protein [Halobellus clavatus]|uniref:Uncharacterized protein n=1 Tax=Halobellus clavatus TaxID=660517 RepID=A0A1H3DJH0_9EURY|nr:hypothetical protein [Halobellus clavatus]SDX65794.1 hypothetical protein SAMN04487946_101577 [Halobellus clavatus]
MDRRQFLTSASAVGAAALAGCSSNENGNNTNTTEEEDQIDKNGEQYIFLDELETLGQLGTQNRPEDVDDWRIIKNKLEEDEWQEKQENDVQYAEAALTEGEQPNSGGLDTTVEQLVQDTNQIYRNPTQHFDTGWTDTLQINLEQEHEEILFTRAIIRAVQEAGSDSSGLADDITANLAEHTVQQLDLDFNNYKLSTVPATEPAEPGKTGFVSEETRTVEETGDEYGNSGFRHPAAILQYQKNGETHIKYVEQVDALKSPSFKYSIRDPEDSLYHSSLDQDRVTTTPLEIAEAETPAEAGTSNIRFPEHYVTPLEYRKARELENQDLLGLGENSSDNYTAVGDHLNDVLVSLVDDTGITGYDKNPDRNIDEAREGEGGTVVSHEFGDSIEAYIEDPDPDTRQQLENVGRGIYQIRQQTPKDWETPLALTGTIENPEIRATTQETVNQIRRDQAYNQVKERVTAS